MTLSTNRLFLSLWLLACAAAPAAAASPVPGLTVTGRCIDCPDGDTYTIEVVTRVRVRLLDCWCAEMNTTQGKSAQKFAERMALHKPVTLFVPQGKRTLGDAFSFDRALGYVWVEGDDKSINERMVEANYATTEKPK